LPECIEEPGNVWFVGCLEIRQQCSTVIIKPGSSADSQAINFMRLATGKQHRQFTPGNETQGSNQMKYRQGIGRGPVQAIMARVASKQPLDP
jgi:hypothetical protein